MPDSTRLMLFDVVHGHMRRRALARRTERAYVGWMRRFIRFHGGRHPRELGGPEIESFLTWLATERRCSVSTQNQALSAILFLYKEVLELELPWLDGFKRARRPQHLPVVLSVEEVASVLSRMEGPAWLVASLLYGAGLRLLEALQLRVQEVSFARHHVYIRGAKGNKDRRALLPRKLEGPLRVQLDWVRALHSRDLSAGFGSAPLPCAIARKYPGADRDQRWQWLFPASGRHLDRIVGVRSPLDRL